MHIYFIQTQVAKRCSLSSPLFLWRWGHSSRYLYRVRIYDNWNFFKSLTSHTSSLWLENRTTRSYPGLPDLTPSELGWVVGEKNLGWVAWAHTCAKMATVCNRPLVPCCVYDKRPNCYAIWSFHPDTSCKEMLAQLATFSLKMGTFLQVSVQGSNIWQLELLQITYFAHFITLTWKPDYPILPHSS